MNQNKEQIKDLLVVWEKILVSGRSNSNQKAKDMKASDPNRRIHRTTGPPVIFDRFCVQSQSRVQGSLMRLMPEYTDLIRSEPVLQGYGWRISDYIELYFDHYELVVYKLKEILCRV